MPRMLIWLQDPTVTALGTHEVVLPNLIVPGPRSDRLRVEGLPPVQPDSNGDYLVDPNNPAFTKAFDAIHTFTVAQMTVNLYERLLGPVTWHWNLKGGNEPLSLRPHGALFEGTNYARLYKRLTFAGVPPFKPPKDAFWHCRSLDIVAHETGHAVLDGLKPTWGDPRQIRRPETRALHEAFGDLTTLFLALSIDEIVEYVVRDKSGSLSPSNIIAVIGEEYGKVTGQPNGVRNLENDVTFAQAMSESGLDRAYALSMVVSGLVYDTVVALFKRHRSADGSRDPEALTAAADYMTRLVLGTYRKAQPNNPEVTQFCHKLMEDARLDGRQDAADELNKGIAVRKLP